MDSFRAFLKKGGRSPSAIERCLHLVASFGDYLSDNSDRTPETATPEDLDSFVAAIESEADSKANIPLWALHHYYEFLDDYVMAHRASTLRRTRVEQKPFRVRDFPGVTVKVADGLRSVGVVTVDDALRLGPSAPQRSDLALRARISIDEVTEVVELSDLARVRGVGGVRARLYHDAGPRTVAILATRDPEELHKELVRFVRDSGFPGIPPQLGEIRSAIGDAKRLPNVIE